MLLTNANQLVQGTKDEITRLFPDSFGSSMLQFHPLYIEGVTVAHRLRSKFQEPDDATSTALQNKCFTDWIEFDHSLTRFSVAKAKEKFVLYKARELLHSWLRDIKIELKAEFSPGESFKSAEGKTSVHQKLLKKEYWTCTMDAVDDFSRLCYNTLYLKRCAKAHMRKRTIAENKRLYLHYTRKEKGNIGFHIFRHKLLTDVLSIVAGSRASSVPKNNDKRRFINVEPFGNMLLQRCVASSLRRVLFSLGNDLETGQQDHQKLIQDPTVATIDFANASDSVILDIVKFMFPKRVYSRLTKYRSCITFVGDVAHFPNKLSSMGNGFTFEVMTLLLLAIGRVLDSTTRVYGDDVIIHNLVAEQFISATGDIGFIVNKEKTFVNSQFRESCGAFFHDSVGVVTCFDWHWIDSIQSLIVTTNKAFLLSVRSVNPDLKHLFRKLYKGLLSLDLSMYLGPNLSNRYEEIGLDRFIFCPDWRKRSKKRNSALALDDVLLTRKLLAKLLSYQEKDIAIASVPKFSNKQVSPAYKDRISLFLAASYFYAGKRTLDLNRNKGDWVFTRSFVLPHGGVISYRDAVTLINE